MDLNEIYGNEVAKRAVEVALAGPHPLHLVGAPSTGKSVLLGIYRESLEGMRYGLGSLVEAEVQVDPGRGFRVLKESRHAGFPVIATEHLPCPCGYWGSVGRECTCTPQQVRRHSIGIRKTLDRLPSGLWAETERPAARELLSSPPREATEAVLERVREARARERPMALDDNAQRLLETAYKRMYLSPGELRAAVEIGATIAMLSKSDTIRAPHVAEAVQYRAPAGVR